MEMVLRHIPAEERQSYVEWRREDCPELARFFPRDDTFYIEPPKAQASQVQIGSQLPI
jgi:hypothetical protein